MPVEVKHCCMACGEVMEVHEHGSYREIKDCLRGMKALCVGCQSWPGSPLPQERKQGQEVHGNGN
jgi:hypothetical protein